MLNVLPCSENLESVISAAHHGPPPALDIPELGSTEGAGPGNGLFYHVYQVLYVLFA